MGKTGLAGGSLQLSSQCRGYVDFQGRNQEERIGCSPQAAKKEFFGQLASARYELRLAALPPDALIAITAGAMRDSPAANRRAEALLAHHSPPPAVATDVLADPDLAPCVLEKTGLRHAAVCKRWSLICAPRGAFARLVETAGDATSALHSAALGELKRLSEAPATHEGVVASNRATLDADELPLVPAGAAR